MSYILDALRKSDQQRQHGIAPTLSTAQMQMPPITATSRKPALLSFGLIAFVLIGVGVAIGWLRPWQKEQTTPAQSSTTKTTESISLQTLPTQPAPLPTTAAPPSQPTAHIPLAIAEKTIAPPPTPTQAAAQPSPVTTMPATIESTLKRPTDTPAPTAKPVLKAEAPAPSQQNLPNITITVHAYSADPTERMAGINGRLLREGKEVTPGLKLERITEDGVILNFKGHRFRRSLH